MTNSSQTVYTFPTSDTDDVDWMNDLKRRRKSGPRALQQHLTPTSWKDATRVVHAGTYCDPVTGAVGTPLFASSTFRFNDGTYDAFAQGITRDVPIYARYGSPNQWSVQEKIASLELAESSVVFSSGMAAIATTLVALTNNGGHIVSSYDVYGGTYNLLREDMHQMGRSVSLVDPTSIEAVRGAVRPNTQVLFFETVTNPLLKVVPLPEIIALGRELNLLVVLDNTFLTPMMLKPIALGAHVVLHSCTKYLNGHSDVTAGAASGSRKYLDRIWTQMLRLGGSADPWVCFQLERGLKTLALRMDAHCRNADLVVQRLAKHPRIRRIYHPSLTQDASGWLAQHTAERYGGMISFEVEGGDEAALSLLSHLKVPEIATSLGGVESLVSLPFNTSHSSLTAAQRESIGIRPGLVRYSVGIEDGGDLIDDLEQALDLVYRGQQISGRGHT
jgi:cystathionine beta-lyase/cystathionine gamma-synthase